MAGYSGSNHDRYAERAESSTGHKLRSAYWSTKQAVMKKLGRPEDEHVVASDSELDAKLDLFRSVQKTCVDLLRTIEQYQESLCCLSQSENEFGRFLKSRSEHSTAGKTSAGKMMSAVGKSLSFSAQQRLALRVPLGRLHQEVETFRCRAISDTLLTVQRMEAARTDYRGALLWMRKVSEELDPDAYKQLERFRGVQAQVRKCKAKFDKLKLDCMQKVDLLAASRCNLLSHVLALYQDILMQFWAKTSRTMTAVADSFKGYQFYEFNMLKDLVDESRKLATQTSVPTSEELEASAQEFKESLDQRLTRLDEIFTQEMRDDTGGPAGAPPAAAAASGFAIADRNRKTSPRAGTTAASSAAASDPFGLADASTAADQLGAAAVAAAACPPEDDAFLRDLLDGGNSDLANEWASVFGVGESAGAELSEVSGMSASATSSAAAHNNWEDLLPAALQSWKPPISQNQHQHQHQHQPIASGSQWGAAPHNSVTAAYPANQRQAAGLGTGGGGVGGGAKSGDRSAGASAGPSAGAGAAPATPSWFNLFAELDPLSNPDLLSKKSGQISDA